MDQKVHRSGHPKMVIVYLVKKPISLLYAIGEPVGYSIYENNEECDGETGTSITVKLFSLSLELSLQNWAHRQQWG